MLVAVVMFIVFISDPKEFLNTAVSLRDLSFLLYATFFYMLFSGYLITTAVVGVFFGSRISWVYPTIAATLFVAHTQFFQFLLNGWKRPEFTFGVLQASGACIVFACTFVGGRVLSKWTIDKTSLLAK